MMKILLIHNIIAPYRVPLFHYFEENYRFKLLLIQKKDTLRKWKQNFNYKQLELDYLSTYFLKIFGKRIFFLTKTKAIINKINKFNPDIVIIPDENAYIFISILIKRRITKNSKVVIWSSQSFLYKSSYSNKVLDYFVNEFFNFMRKRFLYDNSCIFWAYSENTKKTLIRNYSVNKDRIFVGLQGYPKSLVLLDKEEVDFRKRYDNNNLLFIGYISKRKGLDILVNVIYKLNKIGKNIKLIIISPDLSKKYKNIPFIEYMGYRDQREKYEIINKSKYLILPSLYEPWGWVAIESALSFLPPIISENAIVSEVFSKNLVFTPNENSLQKIILKYISISFNDYLELSNRVYIDAEKHTLKNTIKSFEQILSYLYVS